MKITKLFSRLGSVAFVVIGSMTAICQGQTTYTVNQAGGGDFTTISQAMIVATDGDTVLVTDNAIYQEVVDFEGEDIVLRCDPLDRATIEPPPAGTTEFLIDMSGGLSRQGTLLGFRVRFATAGAIDISDSWPTISSNFIVSNSLPPGDFNSAGITGFNSSPLIVQNVFADNVVLENGGAIFLSGESTAAGSPITQIRENYFGSNTAIDAVGTAFGRKGGAIHAVANEDEEVRFILIQGNDFENNAARGYGGAISLERRPGRIFDNSFTQNLMRFEIGDFYPCGSPVSYGGGAISMVDCDYGVTFLAGNTYFRNWSDYDGGAVYAWNSVVRLNEEDIENSLASCQGGGVFSGEGSVTAIDGCDISDDNVAGQGGGVAFVNAGFSVMTNSEISRNGAWLAGAGVFSSDSEPLLFDLLIDSNGETLFSGFFRQAPVNGGGIALQGGSATIERCEIIRNASLGDGGGIHANEVDTDLVVANCILGANIALEESEFGIPANGAAMYASYSTSGPTTPFSSNTVARNRAESTGFAGVYIATGNPMSVVNGIVWNNKNGYDVNTGTASGPNQTLFNPVLGASGIDVDFTDVVNNGTFTFGVGNITAIPKFVSIPNANFRIRSNSPCVNVGTNTGPISSGDIDGQTRIVDGVIEMGADEVLVPIRTVSNPLGGEPTP
jgi:hypothetical protein